MGRLLRLLGGRLLRLLGLDRGRVLFLDQRLERPHGQGLEHDLFAQDGLPVGVGDPFEHLGVAEADLADADGVLDGRGEVEQADQVGHARPVDAELGGQLVLGVAEPVEVVLEPDRLLDRVQVGPLDVLGQGRLEHLLVVELDEVDRDVREAGQLGGLQPPLAGDQLERLAARPDDQRLQDAVAFDAVGQLQRVRRRRTACGVGTGSVDPADLQPGGPVAGPVSPEIRASRPRPSRGFVASMRPILRELPPPGGVRAAGLIPSRPAA